MPFRATLRVDKANPTLIRIYAHNETIGYLTCEQFRKASGSDYEFIGTLIERFNLNKTRLGEPERAEQVINAK